MKSNRLAVFFTILFVVFGFNLSFNIHGEEEYKHKHDGHTHDGHTHDGTHNYDHKHDHKHDHGTTAKNKSKSVAGYVMDEQGNAVKDADVVMPEKFISVKTGKTGRYVIPFDGEGAVHIEVYKSGFLPGSTKPFKIGKEAKRDLPRIVLQASPLEEVVVTGTSTPKLYRETPVKTAVASKREIEKKGAVNLADSLEMMTGVRVENNCQNCNFNQVRLNGMEGKYSQVLVNGMPVVSSLAGVYLLEQMPANVIERLEVVKGGGSALYGGNAVAGVVNVITKDAMESGSQVAVTQESINNRPNTVLNFNTDYVSKSHATNASFHTNYQRRAHMDYNDDGFSDLGELTNLSLGASFSHNFNKINGKLKLSFNSIFEDRRGGNKFDQPEHYADIAESVRTYRTDFSLGWEQILNEKSLLKFDGSFSYTKRKSYYGSMQDPNAYGNTTNPVFYGTVVYNYIGAGNHSFLAGISFRSDKIKDMAPAYNRVIDDIYTDFGVFLQDEIELFNKKATLLLGLRADKHSEIKRLILSPRASFLFKGVKNVTMRTTFSTGFRAPQVFDEDLHITQVGGEGMVIVNRDGLEEERSYSFSLGFDYGKLSGKRLYQFSVNGFYNRLENVFTLEQAGHRGNSFIFERFNSSGASVYGVEVEAGIKWAGSLEIFTGWTFQNSRLDDPEPDFNSREIFRSPDIYGSVRVDLTLRKIADVRVEMNYTGSMRVPHFAGYIKEDTLEKSKPFTVFNLSLNRRIGVFKGKTLTLTASIYNLFDEYQDDLDRGVYRDAGYIYGPRLSRTFRVGFRYNF